MAYLTVFTATYNRAHCLGLVFDSLMKQKFKDFEWLIVDDGSIDGTDKLIEEFKAKADFPIRYYWKENGGVPSARNYSYPLINSRYTVSMDSDDQFTDNALQEIHDIWESIPENEYNRFWQVSGRCKDLRTGEMVGKPYPQGINQLKGKKQNIARHKCMGEKCCCRKTEILIQYPFPEFPDVKDILGDYIWEEIDEKYDTYCTNKIFRLYESESPDSMNRGKGNRGTYRRTQWYHAIRYVNDFLSHFYFDRRILIAILNLPRLTWLSHTSYGETMKALKSPLRRLLIILVTPLSWVIMKVHDR